MTEAVTFSCLSYSYRPDSWNLMSCSGSVPQGSSLAILGPNGCGKTTLLKLILGLIKPSSGRLSANGQMALVPQIFQLSFAFTVLDIVLMGRARKIGLFSQPSGRDFKAAREALDRVGLSHLERRSFNELSGGQRQLVVLARALVAEAEILLMDEPTSALDLKNQDLVLRWIIRLTREDHLTVIFTTHHPQHALTAADQVFLMLGGGAAFCGPTDEALTAENLHRLYGLPHRRLDFDYRGQKTATIAPVFLASGSSGYEPL
ncbi:MAG: ABC transporter ATP-binding protein [Deltaproteobacteria bacterium]|jgi:iron complex transport system ATP-binding protein|nr:ABC transporter ATP-binding protein [Deltaproteobacteria bacterium]